VCRYFIFYILKIIKLDGYTIFINVSALIALEIHLANSDPLISAENVVVPKSSDKIKS